MQPGMTARGPGSSGVEQRTENPRVGGSIPPLGTIFADPLSRKRDRRCVGPVKLSPANVAGVRAGGDVAHLLQTIAICTHDRPDLLGQCLDALAAADRPDAPFEVIVVANACRQDTFEVARRFAPVLPLVLATEPRPGLSHARNRAVKEARGDLIVWLDDDALVGPGLLRAYETATQIFSADAIFGGTILPVFEQGPPDWLAAGLDEVEAVYAVRRPDTASVFNGIGLDTPFGANFAIRTAVQRLFPFDPALGRRPDDAHSGGEEVAVIRAALAAGHTGRWVPGAVVDHLIDPSRQTEAWIWSHCSAFGRVQAEPRLPVAWLRLRAMRHRWKYLDARRKLPAAEWLPLLIKAAIAAGRLEARKAAVSRAPHPAGR